MSNYLGGVTLIAGLVGLAYWGNAVHAPRMEMAIRSMADDAAIDAVHPLDVRVAGRDIRVRGYVDDEAERDRMLGVFAAIEGRRVVVDELIVLPRADPFEFSAQKAGDDVLIEGHAPSQASRAAIAQQTGAGAGDVSLASGAPLGWAETVQVALDALARLNGGVLQMSGSALRLTGTAETPAEKSEALAILAGLPEGVTSQTDIDIRDDGTLPYEITYDAGAGVAASGHLPKGLDAAAIAALMGVETVAGADMQSGVGSDRIDKVLALLAGWLPEMDLMRLSSDAEGIAVDVALLPGTDVALIRKALSGLEADRIVVRPTERRSTEGARRTNAASGLDEVYTGGYWLPDMRFEANVATCTQKARAVLSRDDVQFVTGSDQLGPRATRAINGMAAVIRTCTQKAGLKAELGGHTDNVGDADANLMLSLRRAEAVVEALVARGVPRTSLIAEGYGSSRPIASNATEEGRAKNRRTTVRWSQ